MPAGDYFDRVNRDLLKLIPPNAKTVLEIGCGAGALCEAYRRINPGVEWIGMEVDQFAAEKAREPGRCTEVYAMDVQISHVMVDADCVIFGDVLEHLKEPWNVLAKLVQGKRPGTQVLASIPNVQSYTMIASLLMGSFAYHDEGLFDRTHLRWFTRFTIKEMFEAAGLQVFEMRGVKGALPTGESDEGQWAKWCNEISKCEFDGMNLSDQRSLQYVVRAIKPDLMKSVFTKDMADKPPVRIRFPEIPKLHIHAVTAEACCARPRILEPFAMLETIPGVRCRLNGLIPPDTDIVILQRPRLPLCDKGILEAHRDKVLIVEIDDHPEYIGIDPVWLSGCHAIQCSTEALAEVCRQYNPNVMVFENQLAELPPLGGPIMDYRVAIFFGAQNRQSDWAPIMPAINRILREHGKNVEFQVVHDREFFDALETTEKTFTPFCEYELYRQILGSCDIALLPLEDNQFNRCKSDIKFLECAAEGVTVLASPIAYGPTLAKQCGPKMKVKRMGITVVRDWEKGLRALIEEPELRLELTRNAYAYVRDNRLLSQHYRKRYEWYQSLLNSKPTLDRQLLERVPELSTHLVREPAQLAP